MVVSALEGHRIWSRQYDESPNPILALETRVLAPRLQVREGTKGCTELLRRSAVRVEDFERG